MLVMAYVLALLCAALGARSALDGALVGVVAWLGFTFTTTAAIALFDRRSWMFVLLTGGQSLVSLVAMGAVLGTLP